MKQIKAYTDGSAVVRGEFKGFGGCGVYFPSLNGKPRAFAIGFQKTKTGRTEIYGLMTAIKAFPKDQTENIELVVYSDSQYVVKAFTDGRLNKWRRNGWQNSSGNVKNKGLWLKLLKELNDRPFLTLSMVWVKAHRVDKEKDVKKRIELMKDEHIKGNMIADSLAGRWRQMKLEQLKKDL